MPRKVAGGERTAGTFLAARSARRVAIVILVAATAVLLGKMALAYWTSPGTGTGIGRTATMSAPASVTGSSPVNSTAVAVSWQAATLSTGAAVAGYFVTRAPDAGGASSPACGTSPTTLTTELRCDDPNVAEGTYRYVVTAVRGSWTAASANSAAVKVIYDNEPPVVTATTSPGPNANGFHRQDPVRVDIVATDEAGVASITYSVNNGSPVTVTASSVSVNVSGNGTHTVTYSAKDVVGHVSTTQSLTVRIDTVAPATPPAPRLVAESDSGVSSSDGVTNVTTPTYAGTAEPGGTVNLYGSTNNAVIGSAAVAADGTYTVTVTKEPMISGTHTMTVRAVDLAGNRSEPSAGTSLTIDTTAPSAPSAAPSLTAASDSGRSSSDRITKVTTPTFTGTGTTDTAWVVLYAGSVQVGSGSASSTSYAVTSGALSHAAHSMTVRVTDVAGNLSSASPSVTVTVDTVAPAAPSAPVLAASSDSGSSSSDGVTNDSTPTMTGSNESLAQVTLFAGSSQVGTETTSGTIYAVTSSTLADGDHVLTATATDVAGNLGPASSGTTVTIDTTPPTPSAPVLTAESDTGESSSDRVTNDTTPTFTGTAPVGTKLRLYDGGIPTGVVVTAVDGTYTATTDTLADGTRSITARNEPDLAGNVGTSPATTITIDTAAPSAPTDAPSMTAASDSGRSSSDRITNNKTPTFTGTGTSTAVRAVLYAGAVQVASGTISSSSYTVTSGALLDAGHSMTVRVSDVAGNLSSASPSVTVTVDTVAPAAPSAPVLAASSDSGSSSSDGVTNDSTPTMTGSNESLAQVTLFAGSSQVGTETTSGTIYSVTSSTLADGDHVLTATATDVAGNLGPASSGTTITIDTTAPAASAPVLTAESDSGVSSSDRVTNDRTPTFTGTAPVGANVRLFSGGTEVGVVNAVDGTYTITVGTLDSGTPSFSARTDPDQAGNVGVLSATTSVTIDFTGPTVTVNELSSSPIRFRADFSETIFGFTSTDVVIGGTALPTSVTVTGSGQVYDAEVSGMQRSGTVTASIPVDGATDRAGNGNAASTSTDDSVDYVDGSAPTVAITSFTAAESQSATVSGNAGIAPGDPSSITVVLCTTDAQTCSSSDTTATLTATVNAQTGAWSVTSGNLGTVPTLYARAAATDLSGNTTQTAAAGPIAIP